MDVPIAIARGATTEANTVNSLIPVHLREGAQNFIDLLEDYYSYLNTDGLPSQEINNITVEQDIDKTSLQYLDSIQREVAMNVPNAVAFDRVSLYKKIVKYYLTKGSRDSILTFFKIFYDEAVVVSYPRELLFAPSMGNYDTDKELYLDDKSFPSGKDKIQDSYFWQNFSYVIESALPVENWKSNFLNLVHPAGFKFFGIISILMVRTNKWIGRHIRFDDVTRKYVLDDTYDPKRYDMPYHTKDKKDLDWMRGLVPPALLTTVDRYSFNEGYHSPTFQYGVGPLELVLNILIIAEMAEDRFNLFIELVLTYVITEPGNHFLRTRDTYLQDTKFLDSDGFSEFKDKKIGESLDDNLLMSQRILHNVSAFVDCKITVSQETSRSILKRVEDITPSNITKDLYTEESYNSDLNFVRNEQCWAKDIKGITSISPWNSRGDNQRAGVAISPRHVIFVEHLGFHPNVGDTIYFVTRDNVTISRQIIQHKNHPATDWYAGDFGIGLLDTPLPDDIEFMKILPQDSYNYFPMKSLGQNGNFEWDDDRGDKTYLFSIDQEEKATIRSLRRLQWAYGGKSDDPDTYDWSLLYHAALFTENDQTGIASTSEWYEQAISGDSGNPMMMLLKGEAVLVSMFTGANSGSFFGQQRNINEVNLLMKDVDALEGIDNSEDITSFVYTSTGYTEEGEQVQSSNTFTKAAFLRNGRPVYLGEGSLNSISWDGNEWIQYRGGAFWARTNNSLDTDYPWQTGAPEAAEGFTQLTPQLVFGTGHKLTQFNFTSENEVEVFTPQIREIVIPTENFVVSGAGTTEVNGLYIPNGNSIDGNIAYTMYDSDGTTALYNLWSDTLNLWFITSNGIDDPSPVALYIASVPQVLGDPPSSGWYVCPTCTGEESAPTISPHNIVEYSASEILEITSPVIPSEDDGSIVVSGAGLTDANGTYTRPAGLLLTLQYELKDSEGTVLYEIIRGPFYEFWRIVRKSDSEVIYENDTSNASPTQTTLPLTGWTTALSGSPSIAEPAPTISSYSPPTQYAASDILEINGTSFDTTATHIKLEGIDTDTYTYFEGIHKLIYKSSNKLMFKKPNYDTNIYSFDASITLGKLDTYIAPSKYKKYTENIQQIKDKFS